jgi:signal transduction histidine kinase
MPAAAYRVLIVDDSPEDRKAFRRYLSRTGDTSYLVSEASTGAEGLACCREDNPDCILLDYNLPDLNGIEFIEHLNNGSTDGAPAVVMLTGQGNEDIAVRAMKAGAQDYLVKGFAAGGISRAIHTAIENVILRRRVVEQERNVQRLAMERSGMVDELASRAASLAEADHRKDEFLATLAHELRNPLAPISNSIHLLLQSNVNEETAHRLYKVLERQTRHMVRLVDDLMEISRITRGKLELRLATIDLNAVIRNAVETSRPLIEAAGHDLSVTLTDEALWIEGDEVRLEQVLSNLLNNAAKYTETGGRIALTARRAGSNAIVSVVDSGIGIPAEMLPRVFELFTQVDTTLGRAQGGLGIGLTLASRLTELHGGRLEARSDGIGKGSEFIVILPLGDSLPGPQQKHSDHNAPLASKHRVLVVDDNEDSAVSLAMLLDSLGAEVQVADGGEAALNVLHGFDPDIVILDIGMPGMDGYELANAIRGQRKFDKTLLVALTGWGQKDDITRSTAAGIDRHMVKPVDLSVLHSMLATLAPK